MHISGTQVGDVTILDLQRGVFLGNDYEILKDRVDTLLRDGRTKIILNMEDVPVLTDAGLGTIVMCHICTVGAGGSLRLLKLSERVKSIFKVTKLASVFETFDSEDEAVASFAPRTEATK